MPYPHLLSNIVKQTWAIEPRFAHSFSFLVSSLLNGMQMEAQPQRIGAYLHSPSGEHLVDYDQAPKGSIAIVPLQGAMLKHDTPCEFGTVSLAGQIRLAADHKNIKAIILDIDSGGGAINALPPILDAIDYARGKMPVIAHCDVAASAAYYTAVHCDQIILSNEISAQVGSIGVMISFADMQPMWEREGVKFHTIYAPESSEKNKAFELALKGDYELIQQEVLSPLARQFQQVVTLHRPNLDSSVPGILSGRMFFAREALQCGMIDGIGTLEQALDIASKLSERNHSPHYSQNPFNKMDPRLIASLLTVLGYTELASQQGFVSLPEADINKIKQAYKAKHGRELQLQGMQVEEGFARLSEASLISIEQQYNKPAAQAPAAELPGGTQAPTSPVTLPSKLETRIAAMEQQIATLAEQGPQNAQLITELMAEIRNLSTQSDVIVIQNPTTAVAKGSHPGFVFGSGFSWDKAHAGRPWNMRAIGMPVVEGSSSIDLDRVIEDLGNYSRQRRDEIITFMRDNNIVNKLFPFISGINDEVVFNNLFLGEFTQAYQDGWTPKGRFRFEPEIVKMFRIKIDHEFTSLKAMELTWLSDLNKEGSNAYKMSFVGFLINEMLMKAAKEDSIAAINGVFQEPTTGVAGSYLSKMDGLRKYLRIKALERKIIECKVGEWNETNILDWERALVEQIPEEWRDAPNLALYASTRYMEIRYNRKKVLEGGMVNYEPEKSTIDNHENIRLIAIPYMGDSKRVFITPIGNIRQLEFIPREETFLEIEKTKRYINVFCDYKRGIQALAVGRKWKDDETPDMEHQMIWMNNVDLPTTTFVKMKPDDATPSALEHTSMESVDNASPLAITDIKDVPVGGTVTLRCGSDANAPTIAKSGKFAHLTAAWSPSKGDTITLFRRGTSDWIDLGRTTVSTTAIAFTADDDTPSVAGGTEFVTVANTVATAITTLDDAVVGRYYTLYGGSNTNSSTIANAGSFDLTAAMTLSEGSFLKLFCRAASDFVEIERG